MRRRFILIGALILGLIGGAYWGVKAARWVPIVKLLWQSESELSREDWLLFSGECYVVQAPSAYEALRKVEYHDQSLHILDRSFNSGEWDRLVQGQGFDEPDALVVFFGPVHVQDYFRRSPKMVEEMTVGGLPAIWWEEENEGLYSGIVEISVPFPIGWFLSEDLFQRERRGPVVVARYQGLSPIRRDRAMEVIESFRIDFRRRSVERNEEWEFFSEILWLSPMEQTKPLQSLDALKGCGLRREDALEPKIRRRSLVTEAY